MIEAGARAALRPLDPNPPAGALVIGLGNGLRRDDGAGPWLAQELDRRQRQEACLRRGLGCEAPAPLPQGLRVLVRHQLGVELAEDLARCQAVLFIDACSSSAPGAVASLQVLQGNPAAEAGGFSHSLTPVMLLQLTQQLYGARPAAALLLLPAHDLGHGLGLSAGLRRQLPRARWLLRRWLQDWRASHA